MVIVVVHYWDSIIAGQQCKGICFVCEGGHGNHFAKGRGFLQSSLMTRVLGTALFRQLCGEAAVRLPHRRGVFFWLVCSCALLALPIPGCLLLAQQGGAFVGQNSLPLMQEDSCPVHCYRTVRLVVCRRSMCEGHSVKCGTVVVMHWLVVSTLVYKRCVEFHKP